MSEFKRFTSGDSGYMLWDKKGGWVRYEHHLAEVERLKAMLPPTAHTGVRNGPGEGSWSVFAGKVMEERDEAQAEVKRLTQELEGRRATNQRVMAERDAARANAITDAREKNGIISRLVEQRDAAQAEVKRLQANGQGMLDTSRPSEEDIWREAFMVLLRKTSYAWERTSEEADRVLAVYRKRWPRCIGAPMTDHLGDANKKVDAATTEDSSVVETEGDTQ